MLTYDLTKTGSDSLYVYLYKCIKNDILDGELSPGMRLPSKRSFAKNLGISNITVENAYALLQAEGYVYSIEKKGFYVSAIDVLHRAKSKNILESKVLLQKADHYIADFVSNKTIPDKFPFSIWARLMREIISIQENELMTSSPCGGVMELRSAICTHLKQFRDMDVLPEQIIIGAGTDYLYSILIQLLGRNKTYAIENPGYAHIAKVYQCNEVAVRYVEMDEHGIKIDDLDKADADVLHISPSHHYPTGIVTPVSRRYELLGWSAKKPGRYIIEDDYDSEFRLTGKPMPTLQSIDAVGTVIYMNTFTKSLASTIRISYMILPEPLFTKYYQKLDFYSSTVSNFEQYTLAQFISGGYFEKHINRMRNYYRNVRDELLKEIQNSKLAQISEIHEEEAGLHFLMKVNTKLSDQEIIQNALQKNVRISCLSQYYENVTSTEQAHTLILNYTGIQMKVVQEAIKALESVFM